MIHTDALPTFRAATRDDTPAIEALLTDAGLPTTGVATLLHADPQQFVVAAERDGEERVVAVAGLEVCCDNALLRSVAVHREWQRHGLGVELVRRVVCEAEARGIHALYLLTMTAEHYFPRFGFEVVGRSSVPSEIAGTVEFASACPSSAIAMTKALDRQSKILNPSRLA